MKFNAKLTQFMQGLLIKMRFLQQSTHLILKRVGTFVEREGTFGESTHPFWSVTNAFMQIWSVFNVFNGSKNYGLTIFDQKRS